MSGRGQQDGGPTRRVRVLVAEGDRHLRTVLGWLLSEDPRVELVGAVDNGDGAAAWVEPLDAALVDVALPGLDAIQVIGALRERHPHVTVVAVADADVPYLRAAATQAGAAGYVNRAEGGAALVDRLLELHAAASPP